MSVAWYRHDAAGHLLLVNIHVQPNAKVSGVAGLHGDALRVRVAAPAVDNKANGALLDFLRRELDLPARALEIRRGTHGRRKLVAIASDEPRLIAKLAALAGS